MFCGSNDDVLMSKRLWIAKQLIKENEDKSKFVQTYW